jgi:hypothetical protein
MARYIERYLKGTIMTKFKRMTDIGDMARD